MSNKSWWITILAGGSALALMFGALIYLKHQDITESREEVAQVRTRIVAARKQIEGTAALERDVIVLREMSAVIRGILPDNEDINNLVRTFQTFSEDSNVRIRGLKKKPVKVTKGQAFDKVAYTVTLEADAFEFMDFMDLIETHSRFISVPSFKLTAAKRTQFEEEGVAAHNVQIDVETYVYEPTKDAAPVRIEGYERKRDLLVGEINRRRQALTVSSFNYRGARGRRDPWVDPRVPVAGEGETALSVQEQMDIVQQFVARTEKAHELWALVKEAENVISEMMARHDLEEHLTALETEVRRTENEASVRYVPSARRLQLEVVDALFALREELAKTEGGRGPSIEKLREVLTAMGGHLQSAEYELMIDTYRMIDDQLEFIKDDPVRKPFVDELRRLAAIARTVIDFDKIEISVRGIAIIEGEPPAALINGRTVGVGDMIGDELIVRAIRTDEIEFIFRGVILAHRF